MIKFMTLPQQKSWKIDGDPHHPVAIENNKNDVDVASQKAERYNFVASDGIHDIRHEMMSGKDDYIVCSNRNSIIWDLPLVERVEAEIAAMNAISIDWLCLVADGLTIDGKRLAAAFFDAERTLTPDRGRNCVVQTSGLFYVFNVARLQRLGLLSLPNVDFVEMVNQLIIIGYANGLASLQTDRLYPCFADQRRLGYVGLEEQVGRVNAIEFLSDSKISVNELTISRRCELLREWVQNVARELAPNHTLSFVIRSIFKRPFLLRRCLISIDYICRSLDMPVEIVITTDIDPKKADDAIAELEVDFPNLRFVRADGNSETGHSRVRNLVAGIKATTGTRVAIIDDDDFYTPEAVGAFSMSCRSDHLVLFDTQIVNEKWDTSGVKAQRELISYGYRHQARGWVETVSGYNSIPLCGVIYPGDFARAVIEEYEFRFDYSEDFVFHLMTFTHRLRSPLMVLGVLGAFQSHRVGDDNVSTVEDRTPWVLDVGNGTYQLLIERGYAFEVLGGESLSSSNPSREEVEIMKGELARTSAALRDTTATLARTTAELRRMQRELA